MVGAGGAIASMLSIGQPNRADRDTVCVEFELDHAARMRAPDRLDSLIEGRSRSPRQEGAREHDVREDTADQLRRAGQSGWNALGEHIPRTENKLCTLLSLSFSTQQRDVASLASDSGHQLDSNRPSALKVFNNEAGGYHVTSHFAAREDTTLFEQG